MKRNKTDGLIYIYEKLVAGSVINKKCTSEKLEVSTKTVSRYVNDLNAYFSNENKSEYIIFSKEKSGYMLKSKDETMLSKKDVLVISKVLLENRGFIKEEIKSLIHKLFSNCIYTDKKYIGSLISNELENYVQPRHNKYLIDKVWELSHAINEQRKVEIQYSKIGINGKIVDNPSSCIVYPQGLLCSEYYFYLVAFIEGKDFEYPAIYRLDRINEYKISDEGFKVNYKKRFKEGEFKNLIQFMQAGKTQVIKFKFKGGPIEAVLDRLPTAEIIGEQEGEYIIKANVFERGIKMWLLSQGDAVEVLEPGELKNSMKETLKKMLCKYKD